MSLNPDEQVNAVAGFLDDSPKTTRGLLVTDHVILNHGQVTWTTPELAPPLLTTTPTGVVSALDRFSVHRCPTRRNFSGTGLEFVTKPATIRYLYHSATAATRWRGNRQRTNVRSYVVEEDATPVALPVKPDDWNKEDHMPRLRHDGHSSAKEDKSEEDVKEEMQDCKTTRRIAMENHRQDPAAGIYIPECTSEGQYVRAQCHRSPQFCWCVHPRTGRPIKGTTTQGYKPDCESARRGAKNFKGEWGFSFMGGVLPQTALIKSASSYLRVKVSFGIQWIEFKSIFLTLWII
ncbi:SPARC-related modular calcium-binding protein 1 [Trichonephila clavipes]|nr:SPARC-related modular calcium-binding protein 1 [Trichonephila clavipes]